MRPFRAFARGGLALALAWGLLHLAPPANADAPPGGAALPPPLAPGPAPPLSLECLASMGWPELEALYRQGQAVPLPSGYSRGRAIYCPDQRFARARTCLTGMLWHGKIVDGCGSSLVNQWLGAKAVKARLYFGPSWLDGQTSLLMDYRGSSHVWSDVRDEVRQVAPGLFLGIMYRDRRCGPELQMYFALEAPTGCCPQ